MNIRIANRIMPSWVIYNVDLMIGLFSIILAYLLRFNFRIPLEYSDKLVPTILLVLSVKAAAFYFGRTHANIIRYTNITDLLKIIIIVLASTIALFLIDLGYYFLVSPVLLIPLSIIGIDFFISAYIMVFARMVIKHFFRELKNTSSGVKINALIFGSEELAISVKRALDLDPENGYKIVAFIDNEKGFQNKKLEGLEIFNIKKLESILKKYEVKRFIFAKAHISPMLKAVIVDKCLNHDVKVMSVPNVKSWIKGSIDVKQIKNIRIEDLLERDPIALDTTEIEREITNKTILVTGAAGSIGSEIVRQICAFNPFKIIMLDQAETPLHNLELELTTKEYNCKTDIVLADLTNEKRIKQLFEEENIDLIYHAAAYKHVPMMEAHPKEAVKNNIHGTKILADCALNYKVAKFVMISTDKAVNPTNVMGASKRIAEIYTQSLNEFGITSFVTTRFGNVLGSNGSVIPLFKKQIEEGGPITVTDPEVCRFFMTIPEACQLVLEASAMGKGGEIFIFDMGKSIKISDLAKNMIRLAGLTPGKDIEIKYTGLRPGEKLYEELLTKEENTIHTHNPKIMIAKVRRYNFEEISGKINELIASIEKKDDLQIVGKMKDLVPEYKSHNSIFKVLDNEIRLKSLVIN